MTTTRSNILEILKKVGEGAHSEVYEARDANGAVRAVKFSKPSLGQRLGLIELRREASLVARIHNPNLPRIHEVNEFQGRPFIAMEYIEGQNLAQIRRNRILTLDELKPLFFHLALTLHRIHTSGVIHRDLKPENILVPQFDRPCVIDFGLAANLNRENQLESEALGSFLFASPEQLGVIETPVSFASDLYSLGAVFYFALTGRPPFAAAQLSDLLEKQMAFKISSLESFRSDVPAILQKIMAQLLQKFPETRYSSTTQLLEDLSAWSQIPLSSLSLATRSRSFQLVGREKEIEIFDHEFLLSQKNKKGITVAITGPAGQGKSSLAQEILKRIGGSTLRLQFYAHSAIPYGALADGFNMYLKQNGADRPRELAQKFNSSLLELFPDLQTKKNMSSISEETDIQNLVDFFSQLAREKSGLVFYFDDFQWIDSGTLKVFHRLHRASKDFPLYLVLTSRNENLSATEDVIQFPLRSFSAQNIKSLIESNLPGRAISSEIFQFFIEKSDGTPFLTLEYLRLQLEKGALYPAADEWLLDRSVLSENILSGNIISVLLAKLSETSAPVLKTLSTASCLGLSFSEEILASILNIPSSILSRHLQEGQNRLFIEKQGSSTWVFLHDRLRESLQLQLTPQQMDEIHFKAAQVYSAIPTPEDNPLRAARHLSLLPAEKDPHFFYQTFLSAGEVAFKKHGYQEAFDFWNLAFEKSQVFHFEIRDTHLEMMAEACVKIKNVQLALNYFEKALQKIRPPMRRAEVLLKISQSQFIGLDMPSASASLEKALQEIREQGPSGNLLSLIPKMFRALGRLFSASLLSRVSPLSSDQMKKIELTSQLFDFAAVLSFFQQRTFSLIYVFLMSAWPALRMKDPRFKLILLCNAGTLFAIFSVPGISYFFLRRAKKQAVAMGTPEALGHFYIYHGMSLVFLSQEVEAEQALRLGLTEYGSWIGFYDFLLGAGSLMTILQVRGHCQAGIQFIDQCTSSLDRRDESLGRLFFWGHYLGALIHAQTGDFGSMSRSVKNVDQRQLAALYDKSFFATNEVNMCWESEEYGAQADQAIHNFYSLKLNDLNTPAYFVSRVYAFEGYIYLRRLLSPELFPMAETIQSLKKLIRRSWFQARIPYLRAHRNILKAAVFTSQKKFQRALKALDAAEKYLRATDDRIGLYEWFLQKALLVKSSGDLTSAQALAREALLFATQNSWEPRRRLILRLFPDIQSVVTPVQSLASSSEKSLRMQDLLFEKKLRAVHQLHLQLLRIVDLEEVKKMILQFTVDLLHAERALLFLINEETNQLVFSTGRDSNQNEILVGENFSQTAIQQCRHQGQPFLLSAIGDEIVQKAQSVVAHGLKSIIVCPLKVNEQWIGVLYLDNRIARGVFSEGDKDILLDLSHHIAFAIEQNKALRLRIANAEMQKDLALTGLIQKYLLPDQDQLKESHFQMVSYYKPAVESGGDWWQYYLPADGGVSVLVGDVTGHGAGSAMVTALLSGAYKSFRNSTQSGTLAGLLTHLDFIIKTSCQDQYWMSIGGIEWSPATEDLHWVTQGNPPLLLIDKNSKQAEWLQESTNQLGQAHFSVQMHQKKINSPHRLLLFTDGLIECKNERDRALGIRQIEKYLISTLELPLEEVRNGLQKMVHEYVGTQGFDDDLCFVLLDLEKA